MDKKTYYMMLYAAAKTVVEEAKKWATDIESEKLADIVVNHAIVAAVAGMAAGILPGVALVAAAGIAIGAIWHMYYAVGKYLRLKFGKDILKAAAAAIFSNMVHQLWGAIAIEIAMAIVPGFAIPATGLILFAVTYFSGLTFLLLLDRIFKAGGDPTKMSADDIKHEAKKVTEDVDFNEEYKKAKEGFKKMREEGNLEEQAKGVDIESD